MLHKHVLWKFTLAILPSMIQIWRYLSLDLLHQEFTCMLIMKSWETCSVLSIIFVPVTAVFFISFCVFQNTDSIAKKSLSKSKREIWMAVFLEDIFYVWDMECIFYIGHSLLYWIYVFYIILTMHCNESECFLFCFLHVKNSTCYILYNNIQGLSHSKSLHWH